MESTLDMQGIRHLNLFGKITKVNTRFYFNYNRTLIFCVPKQLVQKAIGKEGKNVKKIREILRRRIKIIPSPRGISDAKQFIQKIVEPNEFRDLEITGDEIIISAGKHSKAALIGRNKRRLIELQKIVRNFFDKNVRIV